MKIINVGTVGAIVADTELIRAAISESIEPALARKIVAESGGALCNCTRIGAHSGGTRNRGREAEGPTSATATARGRREPARSAQGQELAHTQGRRRRKKRG